MKMDKHFLSKTKIAKTYRNFFKDTVNQLGINKDEAKFDDKPVLSKNSVDRGIEKFQNHLRVN